MLIVVQRNGNTHEVLVSYESIPLLEKLNYKWHVNYNWSNDSFYAKATVYQGMLDGKPKYEIYRMNRILVNAKEGEYVDHINHNTLDNRLENLRITDNITNILHRKSANKNSTTGVRNVSYDSKQDKYIVQLQVNGRNKTFGTYDNLTDAEKLANELREKYYNSI